MFFWLVCAVMILIALAFVLPPLLQRDKKSNAGEVKEANLSVYRDQLRELESDLHNGIVSQPQYEQDREEIERRLLQDLSESPGGASPPKALAARNLAYLLGIALPLIAVLFYLPLANQNGRAKAPPTTEAPAATASSTQSGPMTQPDIEANVAALAKRLEQNPNDAKGWSMLARSYSQMQRHKDAAEAYEHATALAGNDADLWAEYALTVATINGKEMQGKPMELVSKALAIDPQNGKALILAGNAAFALKNYDQAIKYWEKLLQALPPDSAAIAQPLTERIAEAKRLAKATPTK